MVNIFPYFAGLSELRALSQSISKPLGISDKASLTGCKSKYFYSIKKAYAGKRNKNRKFKKH